MKNFGPFLLASVVVLLFVYAYATVCPDHSSCESSQTCCQLVDGSYGCCNYQQGVCCSDKAHCCPRNYQCDLSRQRCVPHESNSVDEEISWNVKTSKNEHFNRLMHLFYSGVPAEKQCAGCKDGSTCCKDNGCCPFSNGVCCPDGEHCCPENTQCDATGQTCMAEVNLPGGILLTESAAEKLSKIKSISGKTTYLKPGLGRTGDVCPGGKTKCAANNTCCEMQSGDYGCCPYLNASCCSDKQHCCPSGYECDVPHARCIHGEEGGKAIWGSIQPGKPAGLRDVVCPGGQQRCPEDSTCCQLASGDFGCCPHPLATCCSDQLHCCPNGYKCDIPHSRCIKDEIQFDMTPISRPETPRINYFEDEDIVCPDGSSKCPDGSTCCELPSGKFGCCPYPHADCCSDHLHCCPQGMTCDMAEKKCVHEQFKIDFGITFPATELTDIVCPGGKAKCPDGTTCCQLSSGDYGCCPYPVGICCSDKLHCCPHGTKCDIKHQQCIKGLWGIRFAKTLKATPIKIETVVCPGGQYKCPDETTCCVLESGAYGCCPYPNAVCCTDKEHCCPEGTQCDLEHSRCVQQSLSFSFAKILKADLNSAERS